MLQEEQGGLAWGKLRAEWRQPRPRAALSCAGLPPQAPTPSLPRSQLARSAPGHIAGHVVRAPGVGGCRRGGGHVVGRGCSTWPRRQPSEGWPGPGPVTAAGARWWELCALQEKSHAFVRTAAAVGAVDSRRGLAHPHRPLLNFGPADALPHWVLGSGTQHPRRGGQAGGAWGRLRPRGGNLGKSEPRPPPSRPRPHLAMTPPTAPWPLPFLPDPSPRSPACLPRERSPLLLSAAPPRRPLPGGRPENPERRSAALPGPGGLTGHAQ